MSIDVSPLSSCPPPPPVPFSSSSSCASSLSPSSSSSSLIPSHSAQKKRSRWLEVASSNSSSSSFKSTSSTALAVPEVPPLPSFDRTFVIPGPDSSSSDIPEPAAVPSLGLKSPPHSSRSSSRACVTPPPPHTPLRLERNLHDPPTSTPHCQEEIPTSSKNEGSSLEQAMDRNVSWTPSDEKMIHRVREIMQSHVQETARPAVSAAQPCSVVRNSNSPAPQSHGVFSRGLISQDARRVNEWNELQAKWTKQQSQQQQCQQQKQHSQQQQHVCPQPHSRRPHIVKPKSKRIPDEFRPPPFWPPSSGTTTTTSDMNISPLLASSSSRLSPSLQMPSSSEIRVENSLIFADMLHSCSVAPDPPPSSVVPLSSPASVAHSKAVRFASSNELQRSSSQMSQRRLGLKSASARKPPQSCLVTHCSHSRRYSLPSAPPAPPAPLPIPQYVISSFLCTL